MDLLGRKYKTITGATGTESSVKTQAIKALNGSITLTLTPQNPGDGETIVGAVLQEGDVFSFRSGWKTVQKTAGDGVAVCYYE